MVDASLILQGAVAVGTLSLAGATYYQARLLVRERKAATARELAEKIYTPLRPEVSNWRDIELVGQCSWSQFKNSMPLLILKVPEPIGALLDQAAAIIDEMARLQAKVYKYCEERIIEFGWQLARDKGQQTGLEKKTAFQVLANNNAVFTIDQNNLPAVWVSGKDLNKWISDYFTKRLPDSSWDVQVLVGGQKFGGLEDANRIVSKLFEGLAEQPFALRLRDQARTLKPIGVKLSQKIDQEIEKAARLDR